MRNVAEVLQAGMCSGCGLCVRSPSKMQIDAAGYLRPLPPPPSTAINQACPGRQVTHHNHEPGYNVTWGPIVSSQTGYAIDPEIRLQGSSGGVITALLIHLLNNRQVDAVIQVGASLDDPIRNATYIHNAPRDVLNNSGSRYAPSAPLSVIQNLLGNGKKYAFVGKPCDVAALRAFLKELPKYEGQFPYLLSFMCAGVPSEHGTEAILAKMGAKRDEVVTFRYRGDGWPGLTKATSRTGETHSMTYNQAWGTVLNRFLQPRCKVCADGCGEAADVVCADAWHASKNGYPSFEERDGRSLILVRTQVGQKLINEAFDNNIIGKSSYCISELMAIQPYQANRKHTALARKLALNFLGSGAPTFRGYALDRAALKAGLSSNLTAFTGTLLRKLRGRM